MFTLLLELSLKYPWEDPSPQVPFWVLPGCQMLSQLFSPVFFLVPCHTLAFGFLRCCKVLCVSIFHFVAVDKCARGRENWYLNFPTFNFILLLVKQTPKSFISRLLPWFPEFWFNLKIFNHFLGKWHWNWTDGLNLALFPVEKLLN